MTSLYLVHYHLSCILELKYIIIIKQPQHVLILQSCILLKLSVLFVFMESVSAKTWVLVPPMTSGVFCL